jgi:Tol biopolymer transport system component
VTARPVAWILSVVLAATAAACSTSGEGTTGPAPGSFINAISPDGSFVVFTSDSAHIVRHDVNSTRDVFLRRLRTGRTTLVSVGVSGRQANGSSRLAAATADGSLVAFQTLATNLGPVDRNHAADVYVRDLRRRTTTLVSAGARDLPGNGPSGRPDISADGRLVAFESDGTDLVGGDDDGVTDVFLRDLSRGATVLVSQGLGGRPPNGASSHAALSSDGRYMAFQSDATNLVRGDRNHATDVFVRDLRTGRTALVSVARGGRAANGPSSQPAVSGDGGMIAFQSQASNLVGEDRNRAQDVFARDVRRGRTGLVSVSRSGAAADGNSAHAAVSLDGNVVAFDTGATNLVRGDRNGASDVIVRDLARRRTIAATLTPSEKPADGDSFDPSLSADGSLVAFDSDTGDLVSGDSNGAFDVFVVDLQKGTARLVSVPAGR